MIAASMPVPDFQGSLLKSTPIEQKHETVIDPGREKTKISTKYHCYLHKNYLILIPQQHSICSGCLWEKKANMEHWYFCEMACTNTTATKQWELMYCSNDFFFSCFNLKKKEKKLLSWIKTTQNSFYSFEIFKRIPAHTVYKKEAKQI